MTKHDPPRRLRAFSSEDVELSELGIDNTTKPPSLHNFPPKFSQSGFAIWRKVLNEHRDIAHETLNFQWKIVAEAYIASCNRHGIFPWKTSAETSKTDVAVYVLSHARRNLKRFFKKIGLFKRITILSTSRSYVFKKDSFAIEFVANLQRIPDKGFADWLTSHPPKGPLFKRTGHSGQLYRRLYESMDSEVSVHFDLLNKLRPRLAVNIKFNSPILLPHRDAPLTKAYIVNYVDQNIWLPIVRSNKFDNAGWRLF